MTICWVWSPNTIITLEPWEAKDNFSMACFLHRQLGLVSEGPYRPVQTIVRSLSSLFKLVPCVAEPRCSSLPPLALFPPFLLCSGLVFSSSLGISDYITNRWGGVDCQGHWVCEGSWLTLPTESIPCQFEWVPALVLLELSSTKGRSWNPSCALQMDNRNLV